MGWFEEQIKARKEQDEDRLEESFIHVAASVLGKRGAIHLEDEKAMISQSVDEILRYYHYKTIPVPDSISDPEERLEYSIRPHGVMRRFVTLDKGWYKRAYGPMLGRLVGEDVPVALIPGRLYGYYYTDPRTGKKIRVNRRTASGISTEAYCFYRAFPTKSLGLWDLIRYMVSCITRVDVYYVVAAAVVISGIDLLVPLLTHMIAGPVVSLKSGHVLIAIAVSLVLIRLSGRFFMAVKELLVKRMQLACSLFVESAVMARLLSLGMRFFKRFNSGELATRAMAAQEVCDIIIEEVFGLGLISLTSLITITQIVHFSPSLVAPSMVIILLTFIVMIISTVIRTRINRKHMQHEAKERGLKYAMITGIRKIRLAGAENRAFARWADMYAEGAALRFDPSLILKVQQVVLKTISLVGTIVVFAIAFHTNVDIADYYAFNASFAIVMGAFSTLAGSVTEVAKIRPAMQMAEPIMKEQPETDIHKETISSLRGGVELNHVSFRYRETMPYVFRDLTVQIRPGEYVAIVGKTGCGKTTLVRLLLGFEKPDKGGIYYGNMDISRIDLTSLRSQIGVVMQNGELLPGSIFDNISLSKPMMTAKDAWEAAEMAQIADDIRDMPMGMNTMISEGQGGISGGQKQRLLIARALAPKPKILILDEATSALDNRTQKQVTQALDSLDCTRIVIAHRLSTIRHCDRILVMDDGRIVESGTYEELVEKDGVFNDLVKRQKL